MKYSSMFRFTETYTSVNQFKNIKEYHTGSWESVHEHRGHGLAFCYDSNKIEIISRDFDVEFGDNIFEIFPIGIKFGNQQLLMVLIYRPPSGSKIHFLRSLQQQIDALPRRDYDRLIVLGDFNLDQKSPQHINCFLPFTEHFDLIQRSTWSTHRDGGILDLVFDSEKSNNSLQWMPSPFSDHFVLLVEI